jgi:hypothetical protein
MSRQPRLLTMIVLACALFLRVLVPAGWMPAPKNGAFAIELCSAAAPAQAIEHAGTGHHGSKGNSHGGDCAFAPLQAGFATAPAASVLPAPAAVREILPQQFLARTFARGPPAPPPPARGPPTLA